MDENGLDQILQELRVIHGLKLELLKEIIQLEIDVKHGQWPLVCLLNWIRSDFHLVKYMTRTLGEFIHSLHPDYGYDFIRRTRRRKKEREGDEDSWVWAP